MKHSNELLVESPVFNSCGSVYQRQRFPRYLLTFHAIIMRGDDLPLTATVQPRIGPNLTNLCAWLGLVFADSMFAAIDQGEIVSEEMYFGLIESAIMSGACPLLVLEFIGLLEACTLR